MEITHFLDLLEKANVPSTICVCSNLLAKHGELMVQISEITILLNYVAIYHSLNNYLIVSNFSRIILALPGSYLM